MNVRRFRVHATSSRKLAPLLGLLGLLGAFLLFAQLGALAHTYSHDRAPGFSAIHAADTNCAECSSFAPLQGGAAPSHTPLHIESPAPVFAREEITSSFRDSSLILAFRSRAPPTA
jgi:hypothetical protein